MFIPQFFRICFCSHFGLGKCVINFSSHFDVGKCVINLVIEPRTLVTFSQRHKMELCAKEVVLGLEAFSL